MYTSSQSPARSSLRASELTESRSNSRVINRTLLPRVRMNNSALPFSLGTGTSRALLVVPDFKSMYDAVKTFLHTLPCRSSWVRPTEKSSDICYYRTAPSSASQTLRHSKIRALFVAKVFSYYDSLSVWPPLQYKSLELKTLYACAFQCFYDNQQQKWPQAPFSITNFSLFKLANYKMCERTHLYFSVSMTTMNRKWPQTLFSITTSSLLKVPNYTVHEGKTWYGCFSISMVTVNK